MTEHPGDSDDDLAHAGREVPDLSGAYAELMKGITINAIPAQKLQEMSANFSKAAGLDKLAGIFDTSPMTSFFPNGIVPQAPSDFDFDPSPIDTSPSRTAQNTERMAEALEDQHAAVAQLVSMTASTLALTAQQRKAAERSERFSRRTTITSIFIAAASLGASVAALVVAVLVR